MEINDPYRNLGKGTHYVGDVMNPFHTANAHAQIIGLFVDHIYINFWEFIDMVTDFFGIENFELLSQHNIYEVYVYLNWDTKFKSQYKNFTGAYEINESNDAVYGMSYFSSQYIDTLTRAIDTSDINTIDQITLDCLKEGKKYMKGYLECSRPKYTIIEAICLLQYTEGIGIWADRPVEEMIAWGYDFDNNGIIDRNDAVLLLKHI